MSLERKLILGTRASLDIAGIGRAILKVLLYILLCGFIAGVWTYIAMDYFVPKEYLAKASAVTVVNQDLNRNFREAQINGATEQFTNVLNSSIFQDVLWEELGDGKGATGRFQATMIYDSNVIMLEAAGKSPEAAYKILKKAVSSYSRFLDYSTQGYSLEILSKPQVYRIEEVSNRAVTLSIAIGLLISLIGVGMVGAFHIFSGKIDNEEQLITKINGDFMGKLYHERKDNGKKAILISKPAVSFSFTENMRKIAYRVERLMEKENNKVLMVGSVMENEGKSTVATNIAIALAEREKKVLLMDLDLRKPALAKVLEVKISAEKEIIYRISNDNTIKKAITDQSFEVSYDPTNKIHYLVGTKTIKDNEILPFINNFKELIKILKNEMDYIIIDSSPLSLLQDGVMMASYVDCFLMVVRQGMARTSMINRALEELRESGTTVLGIVLNGVKIKDSGSSKKYGYASGEKYGYYK